MPVTFSHVNSGTRGTSSASMSVETGRASVAQFVMKSRTALKRLPSPGFPEPRKPHSTVTGSGPVRGAAEVMAGSVVIGGYFSAATMAVTLWRNMPA